MSNTLTPGATALRKMATNGAAEAIYLLHILLNFSRPLRFILPPNMGSQPMSWEHNDLDFVDASFLSSLPRSVRMV